MDGWIADASALEQMASRDCGDAGFTPHHARVVHQSSNSMAAARGLVKDSSRSDLRRGCGERLRSGGSSGGCNSRGCLAKLHSAWFSTLRFNFQYPVTTDFQYDWLLRATRPTLALALCGETRITCQAHHMSTQSVTQSGTAPHTGLRYQLSVLFSSLQ